MSEKNIIETVNVNGESEINGDKWTMEKIRSGPRTITPPISLWSRMANLLWWTTRGSDGKCRRSSISSKAGLATNDPFPLSCAHTHHPPPFSRSCQRTIPGQFPHVILLYQHPHLHPTDGLLILPLCWTPSSQLGNLHQGLILTGHHSCCTRKRTD